MCDNIHDDPRVMAICRTALIKPGVSIEYRIYGEIAGETILVRRPTYLKAKEADEKVQIEA